MHPALWQLIWFDVRGMLRGGLRLRKSWKQLGLMALMLTFVGLILSARAFGAEPAMEGRFGSQMPFWAMMYLMATWLTASADRGLVMRPAEVHFIVGGPFRDSDVITLNLLRLAFRALVGASVLSLVAISYVNSFVSAWIGMWMLILVSLLVGMVVSLSARRSQSASIKRARRLITFAALVALVTLVVQSFQTVKAAGVAPDITNIAGASIETGLGRVILPPIAWMFAPISSGNFFFETLAMLPSRLAVIGSLAAAIYFLGSRFAEATTGRTDQSLSRRQTALRSGVSGGTAGAGWTRRLTVPQLPNWGGMGSVAWMQVLHSIRILPRFLAFTTAIVALVLVIPLVLEPERLAGWNAVGWQCGLVAYADFLLLLQLPVGFLGPVAQRELLKSLPIPAWRVALGQLAGPVVPLGVLHVLITVLFLVLQPSNTMQVLGTSLMVIPISLVLVANINLLGSWNIIQPRALQQRDALAAGRAMASVWVFMAMLTPAIVVCTLGAMLSAFILGENLTAYQIGIGSGALLASSFYILLLARSFSKWQPNSSEGGEEETEVDR